MITQKSIERGGKSKPIQNGISPHAVLRGPGTEYGILSSIISYYTQWNHYDVSGSSKIEIYNATRRAYAWTRLWLKHGEFSTLLKESDKCLAPANDSCTSTAAMINGFDFSSGDTAINDAFTEITWSDNSITTTDLINQYTF